MKLCQENVTDSQPKLSPFENTLFPRVECIHPKKRLVLRSQSRSVNTSALFDSVSLTCLNTTKYDDQIKDYVCSPSCRIPTTGNYIGNDMIIHDWPSNVTKPELDDVGKKFALKK